MIATSYLIERLALGHDVFSAHTLSHGWGPITRDELLTRCGRAPDGLVLVPGPERGYDAHVLAADWIEVVRRQPSQTEYEGIFSVARLGSWLNPDQTIRLDRVLVVVDTEFPTENMFVRALTLDFSKNPVSSDSPLRLTFVRCQIGFPLVWQGCEEIDYTQVMPQQNLPSSNQLDADIVT
jgi:hypothetical protein